MTTGIVLTESRHAGGFMVSEANGRRARDNVVIAQSQTLVAGQVLGRTISANEGTATSSAAADASNTGNGTLTLDVTTPVLASALDGNYRAICEVAGASAEWVVNDPNGIEIGRVANGATFNNEIKFVIAGGGTNFAVGDAFTITVGIPDSLYQYEALNLTATDGSNIAAGIIWGNVTTASGVTANATVISRGAEVRGVDLTWPSGATAAQIAEGTRQLEKLGILVR